MAGVSCGHERGLTAGTIAEPDVLWVRVGGTRLGLLLLSKAPLGLERKSAFTLLRNCGRDGERNDGHDASVKPLDKSSQLILYS